MLHAPHSDFNSRLTSIYLQFEGNKKRRKITNGKRKRERDNNFILEPVYNIPTYIQVQLSRSSSMTWILNTILAKKKQIRRNENMR